MQRAETKHPIQKIDASVISPFLLTSSEVGSKAQNRGDPNTDKKARVFLAAEPQRDRQHKGDQGGQAEEVVVSCKGQHEITSCLNTRSTRPLDNTRLAGEGKRENTKVNGFEPSLLTVSVNFQPRFVRLGIRFARLFGFTRGTVNSCR